jgi:hypothetical protein
MKGNQSIEIRLNKQLATHAGLLLAPQGYYPQYCDGFCVGRLSDQTVSLVHRFKIV